MLDILKIRSDFPILSQKVNGKPLVYFDNAATSQKPTQVIEAEANYYKEINANIHRGVHTLSQLATDAYEASRLKIQQHINAKFSHEVLFTSGTTHGINLVANGFASFLKSGDEVMVSALEHHSNIVPWQMLCEKTGAKLVVIPMNESGELILSEYEQLLSDKTKLVTVNHISNALGTINPVKWMNRLMRSVRHAVRCSSECERSPESARRILSFAWKWISLMWRRAASGRGPYLKRLCAIRVFTWKSGECSRKTSECYSATSAVLSCDGVCSV
jgi:cysteine desulfurase/selenocysteine lyase